MLEIKTESPPATTLREMGTDELLHNLGRFPGSVLPTGVLRELQGRGEALHDSVAALVADSVKSAEIGLGSATSSNFFAFALLASIATWDDRHLIESVLTQKGELFGDLVFEATPSMIACLFRDASSAEVIDWIDRLADNQKLDSLKSSSLFRAMSIAVVQGHLDRIAAIDAMVHCLKRRAGRRSDTQSAVIISELLDLSANEVDGVDEIVRSSFQRGQVDGDYIELDSWDDFGIYAQPPGKTRGWHDVAAELSTWCYDYISEDADPVDATILANEHASGWRITKAPLSPTLFNELRQSTDDHLPVEAIDAVDYAFTRAYHATIDLIRDEVVRFQGNPDSWRGNGAYLGLALTTARAMPLPTDLLQMILQMPETDREQVFGDQFYLIVNATALTPLRNHDFIEQWIWDIDRSSPDRREMVDYYLLACYYGSLDRQTAIDSLVAGLQRALREEPLLIAPYAESLAFFTPRKHQQLLEDAFKREDVEWFLPLKQMRQMMHDAKYAKEQLREYTSKFRNVRQVIRDGVMFGGDVYEEKPKPAVQPAPTRQSTLQSSSKTTVRDDVRTPRNAQCPCGSGKKYKKCCLGK
ncbi:YecA family protein [Stieleria varia]|uniref:Preprotein translocase subunit SecA n=1 Tax=Stieleria varia TaxID=2528005 RepID=A0A5C6A546_9BACT|nr:SEC-C metal-binding domain-containing protein [Stieleria varia]TWT94505.1 hypothetical protein Pla52n_53260 [Stieleria varia]